MNDDETIAELRRMLVNMTKERDMLVEIKIILENKIEQLELRLRSGPDTGAEHG